MNAAGLMIDAIDLRPSFKDLEAVAGVNFRVHHCEIFGLLKPKGETYG